MPRSRLIRKRRDEEARKWSGTSPRNRLLPLLESFLRLHGCVHGNQSGEVRYKVRLYTPLASMSPQADGLRNLSRWFPLYGSFYRPYADCLNDCLMRCLFPGPAYRRMLHYVGTRAYWYINNVKFPRKSCCFFAYRVTKVTK